MPNPTTPPLPGRDERTIALAGVGAAGLEALRNARVLVVGAGGLGSGALAYLQAASVGTLGISDSDVVSASNLNRQVIHPQERIGQVKAASAARTIAALNPATRVEVLGHLTDENAAEEVARWDIVVDATDSFASKYLLADACRQAKRPHVWASVVAFTYQVSVFLPPNNLRDLFPAPPSGPTPSSESDGILGAAAGQAGTALACETIKLITNVGTPLSGRVLVADLARGSWDVLTYREGGGGC